MSYIGKKPVDFNDVTEAQTFTVTGDLTVDTDTLKVDSTNNRVGVGEDVPLKELSVVGTVRVQSANGDTNGLNISSDANGDAFIDAGYSVSDLKFGINGSERMRIDSSGNVGIGTSSITSLGTGITTLELKGNSASQSDRSGGIRFTRYDGSDGMHIYNADGASYIDSRSTYPLLLLTNGSERIRIDSSGNVGIGTTSPTISGTPAVTLQTKGTSSATTGLIVSSSLDGASSVNLYSGNSSSDNPAIAFQNNLRFGSATDVGVAGFAERMRIDSSGNLLVGKTTTDIATAGSRFISNGQIQATASGNEPYFANRLSSDGVLFDFRKDGTTVGSINSRAGLVLSLVLDPRASGSGLTGSTREIQPADENGNSIDNAVDMGAPAVRFDDIRATNGTIQTSDRNEKQQIASLTSAEITAAKAISKLFKTFKWNDKVEAKGDAARTHAGVIAQDVQQAMTDAGLNAADYAFFCSDTWWETQTDVPAVAAVAEVLDDDGNVVTEAVEARDAYTRTDIYNTADEAPEGATERTRLGIRYPELLAFIGAATEQRLTHLETLEARIVALENA